MDETFWTAVSAIVALLAVGLTVWATRQAAAAASASAATAREMAQIERDRWHRDLTPELRFTLDGSTGSPRALRIELVGPVGLDRLDRITLSVRDEAGIDHAALAADPDLRPQELARMIWGPYRFRPDVNGVLEPGREAVLVGLERGEQLIRLMEYTPAPSWFESDPLGWQTRNATQPVRLRAECHRDGHRPWTVVTELPSQASVG
ncbi:hypothetical protein [Kitasatospora sp. NPDC088548]|uniref:hypothetical protein n=1 Tax=Kitasatospora sp. NPDC088548 TaxID=3364075 RepID=UPI00380E51C5